MKRTVLSGPRSFIPAAACALAALAAAAAPTREVVGGKYVFSVPENETYTLTADDVAAMMAPDLAAYPLAKTGAGTLVAGAVMADYPNDIHILDGQYKATATTAFGTTNGITYVDGGTVWSTCGAPTGDNAPATGSEAFRLKGAGYNNLGAIRQTDNDCYNFAARGGITLDGDIRVTGSKALEFRYGEVNCNGHAVTVAMSGTARFRFVATAVANPGSVVVESGAFGFESNTGTGTAAQSVTVEPGARLYLQNVTAIQQRTLHLKEGASVEIARNGTHRPGELTAMNQWGGAVTVDAETTVQFDWEGRVFNFSAPISGPGGFAAYGGGYLQFADTNSTFAGGVSVTGKVGAAAGVVTGGVSLVKGATPGITYVAPFAAIPANGAPVRIKDAELGVFNARFAELPDVAADGCCCVTGDLLLVRGTIRSLTKTGPDALALCGPFHVAGHAEIAGGTLRFGTRVPDVPAGLNWHYSWGVTSGSPSETVPANVPFRGVDPSGAALAYRAWPATTGEKNATTHLQAHYYTGYVRVPGAEGEDVACSFISSIARHTQLRIGGQIVVDQRDNKNWITGQAVVTDYQRLSVTGPFSLKAGWQPFQLYMGNHYDGTSGPLPNTSLGWEANFGVGVDWRARCETNSANYAKFLDPGDGSFLRPTLDGKRDVDPSLYRVPTFGGTVAFAPGTVFDVGDATPYTPVAIPSLIGVPTITNGEVHVAGATWTLRAADVAGGVPLTVAANAVLKFSAQTVTVDIASAEDLRGLGVDDGRAIMVAQDGAALPANVFEASAATRAAHWRIDPDGAALRLRRTDGMTVIIR